MWCSQPLHSKPAHVQCCCFSFTEPLNKRKKKFSSSPSQYFSVSMPKLVFSGLICTMFTLYCCTVRTLVGIVRTPHVVPHKGRGIWSKTLVCYLTWCTSSAPSHTPSFPTACPVSVSLTSMDPSVSVPAAFPAFHCSCSGCRRVENRARATAWGGRGKLPWRQSLDLAACISFPNPADKSWCTFPCVIARLSESKGYLRTCFHWGMIYPGW